MTEFVHLQCVECSNTSLKEVLEQFVLTAPESGVRTCQQLLRVVLEQVF